MTRDGTDRRRDQRTIEELGGGQIWYRVRLEGDLQPMGHVSGTIIMPKRPEDPDDPDLLFGDLWRFSGTIDKIYNGLSTQDVIPSQTECWIMQYFGRWVIVIPECT